MCYSDLPYMYTGRGFAERTGPTPMDAQVRARYDVMEYPAAIPLGPGRPPWATHWLNGSPDLVAVVRRVHGRALRRAGRGAGDPALRRASTRWVWRRSPCSPPGSSPASTLAGPGRGGVRAVTGARADRPGQLDLLAVAFTAGALWAWALAGVLTGVLIGLGTATKLYLQALPARRHPRDLPAGTALGQFVAATLAAVAAGGGQLPAYHRSRAVEVFWRFNWTGAPTSARCGW